MLGDGWWWGTPTLLAALAITALVLWRGDARWGVLAAPLLTWTVLQVTLPGTAALWISPRVTASLAAHWHGAAPADAGFGALGDHEPSLMFLAGTNTQWLYDAGDAARFVAAGPDHVALIDRRDQAAFLAAAAKLGVTPLGFATIAGFNYARGRRMVLTLYDQGRKPE